MKLLSGHGPGSDPYRNDPRTSSGLVHGFFHNLCHAVCSCIYVFSCCWLIEDCCMGQRSFPAPSYGPLEPPPPPPPVFGHQHHGLLGSVFGGPSGPPSHPGPFGYSDEPPSAVFGHQHQHHGLLGSVIGGPPGPPGQPGPFGYSDEPPPYR